MNPAHADWRSLYPFRCKSADIDGFRMNYVDEGEGPPLLLVHGNPTWSFFWRSMISGLKDRYRVIVPDLIGHGLSEKPDHRRYEYRLKRRVTDIVRLVEHLNLERATLIAHDWGGGVGMGAAVAMPDRFARFVLMNTAAFRAPTCPWQIHLVHIPGFGQVAVQGLNLFVKHALNSTVAKPERMTAAVRAGYAAPYDSWANRVSVYRFVQDIPLKPSHPSYETLLNIENGLSQFRSFPVCLVWGMQDWCFSPWFLRRFQEIYPQAEAHEIHDASHYILEDAHEQVVPIVERFLQNHPI